MKPRLETFRQFVSPSQRSALIHAMQGEEGEYFRNKVRAMIALFDTMPKTYEQEGLGDAAIVYLHYFSAGADWFITEKDSEPEQLQAFGLADLFGDGGELGYISIVELTKAQVELDLHWTPCTLAQIKLKRAA